MFYYYSLLLQDFSKYLILISKKPESCWLAMSAAYKEDWKLLLEEQVPGVEMCLSQVSDVSEGQKQSGRLLI